MDIISAWKAAKEGQKIRRGVGTTVIKRSWNNNTHSLIDTLVSDDGGPGSRMFDFHVLADDWEVVKEKKTVSKTMEELRKESGYWHVYTHIPNRAKVTIEWDE